MHLRTLNLPAFPPHHEPPLFSPYQSSFLCWGSDTDPFYKPLKSNQVLGGWGSNIRIWDFPGELIPSANVHRDY